jgi:hypothetical protein
VNHGGGDKSCLGHILRDFRGVIRGRAIKKAVRISNGKLSHFITKWANPAAAQGDFRTSYSSEPAHAGSMLAG